MDTVLGPEVEFSQIFSDKFSGGVYLDDVKLLISFGVNDLSSPYLLQDFGVVIVQRFHQYLFNPYFLEKKTDKRTGTDFCSGGNDHAVDRLQER